MTSAQPAIAKRRSRAGLSERHVQVTDNESRDVPERSEEGSRCEHKLGIILCSPPVAVRMDIDLNHVDNGGVLHLVGKPFQDAYRRRRAKVQTVAHREGE